MLSLCFIHEHNSGHAISKPHLETTDEQFRWKAISVGYKSLQHVWFIAGESVRICENCVRRREMGWNKTAGWGFSAFFRGARWLRRGFTQSPCKNCTTSKLSLLIVSFLWVFLKGNVWLSCKVTLHNIIPVEFNKIISNEMTYQHSFQSQISTYQKKSLKLRLKTCLKVQIYILWHNIY